MVPCRGASRRFMTGDAVVAGSSYRIVVNATGKDRGAVVMTGYTSGEVRRGSITQPRITIVIGAQDGGAIPA